MYGNFNSIFNKFLISADCFHIELDCVRSFFALRSQVSIFTFSFMNYLMFFFKQSHPCGKLNLKEAALWSFARTNSKEKIGCPTSLDFELLAFTC